MKRRKFIQTTAMASAATFFYACGQSPPQAKTIGLQLYTLRNIIGKDVQGTMKTVSEIGFKELECYGYGAGKIFDMPYADFNKLCGDLGMKITSGHYGLGMASPDWVGTIVNGWEQAVEDAKNVGQENMILAYLVEQERETLDSYKRVCELLNQANEVCKQAGMKLGYHNHDFEFVTMEGQIPYDVMLQELDLSINMELDLYWITRAGKNPIDYFEKFPGRFTQWHVKDMSKSDPALQTDVGTGAIDFQSIFAKAELSGLKHYYLEQENYAVSEVSSIKNGYKYLQSI